MRDVDRDPVATNADSHVMSPMSFIERNNQVVNCLPAKSLQKTQVYFVKLNTDLNI